MTDPRGAAWPGVTSNGFSAAGSAPTGPQARPGRGPDRRTSAGAPRNLLLGGIAVAVGAGVLFGFIARPDLAEAPSREPMRPAAPPAAQAPAMPIEVAAAPAPAPARSTPLEVLPPDLAASPAAPQPRPAPAPRVPAPRLEVARAPPGAPASARAPDVMASSARPSFNCRYARSRSERMVCGDAELAALDRRLNQAFEQAVASGVPYRALRDEQDDWLAIREDAAGRSPYAVENVYRQRIDELDALAEDAG